MQKNRLYFTLKTIQIIICFLVSAAALWGGVNLIIDPTGASIHLEQYLHKVTFVESYLFLGFLLIILNGFTQFASAWLLLTDNNYAALIVVFSGGVLLIWTSVKLFYIGWFLFSILTFVISLIQLLLGTIFYFVVKRALKQKKADSQNEGNSTDNENAVKKETTFVKGNSNSTLPNKDMKRKTPQQKNDNKSKIPQRKNDNKK